MGKKSKKTADGSGPLRKKQKREWPDYATYSSPELGNKTDFSDKELETVVFPSIARKEFQGVKDLNGVFLTKGSSWKAKDCNKTRRRCPFSKHGCRWWLCILHDRPDKGLNQVLVTIRKHTGHGTRPQKHLKTRLTDMEDFQQKPRVALARAQSKCSLDVDSKQQSSYKKWYTRQRRIVCDEKKQASWDDFTQILLLSGGDWSPQLKATLAAKLNAAGLGCPCGRALVLQNTSGSSEKDRYRRYVCQCGGSLRIVTLRDEKEDKWKVLMKDGTEHAALPEGGFESELDEGHEEEKQPPASTQTSQGTRRSKRHSGKKRRGFYSEENELQPRKKRHASYNEDDEGLHRDKKLKKEERVDHNVKEEGDGASRTGEVTVKKEEEDGVVAFKDDGERGIKEEEEGDVERIKDEAGVTDLTERIKKEENEDEALKLKEEERVNHNVKEEGDGASRAGEVTVKKEEEDGVVALKDDGERGIKEEGEGDHVERIQDEAGVTDLTERIKKEENEDEALGPCDIVVKMEDSGFAIKTED